MRFQSSVGKRVVWMSSCRFFRHIIRVEWVFCVVGVVGSLNATSLLVNGSVVSGSKWTNNSVDATKIYYITCNVGIGTTNPTSSFQVGSGDRLTIANTDVGVSVIGTHETLDTDNARIVLIGRNNATNAGNIEYYKI